MTQNNAEMQAFLARWRRLRNAFTLPFDLSPDFERELRDMVAACCILGFSYDSGMLACVAREEGWSAEEAAFAEAIMKEFDLWKGYW